MKEKTLRIMYKFIRFCPLLYLFVNMAVGLLAGGTVVWSVGALMGYDINSLFTLMATAGGILAIAGYVVGAVVMMRSPAEQ